MVDFEEGVLVGQFFGNYGMLEIYVNVLAGVFLLFASLAAIILTISYGRSLRSEIRLIGSSVGPGGIKMAERGLPGWQYISMGVLYTGLIGFGEIMEHAFTSPIAIIFYNYMTMLSPPIALYFYYIGIKKHIGKEVIVFPLVRFILINILFYILVGLLSLATEIYAETLRNFFVFFIVVPIIILSVIAFREAWRVYEKYLLFIPTVSAMVLSTSVLALSILAGELSFILGLGDIHILMQGVTDVNIIVAGTSILAYGGAVRVIKINRI